MTDTTEVSESLIQSPNRRRFFGAVGVMGAAVVLAACGDDDDEGAQDSSSTTGGDQDTSTTAGEGGGGDAAIAMFAASLEVLAVNTYTAGLEAATSGALGEVPPAVAEYATTAQANHQAQLDAWNEVVSAAGGEPVTAPPAELEATINEQFAGVTDVTGLAMLAYDLEVIAADTYLSVLPVLESPDAVKLAASIQAVDRQHQAILLFAVGEYPVPDVFQSTDKAASPS